MKVGDRVTVIQSYRLGDVQRCQSFEMSLLLRTKEIPAVVHWIKANGEYQIELGDGRRYMVTRDHRVKHDEGIAGSSRIKT